MLLFCFYLFYISHFVCQIVFVCLSQPNFYHEHPNTCRMTVRMQDAIELTMMQEALRQTQTRYPYYSVRLGVTSDANGREHYEYDDNPAPWVLNIGQEPVELFGDSSPTYISVLSSAN